MLREPLALRQGHYIAGYSAFCVLMALLGFVAFRVHTNVAHGDWQQRAEVTVLVGASLLIGAIGTTIAIREQRRASIEGQHRDRLNRVLDAIGDGYWDWYPLTGDLHLGAQYHTMLGHAPGERGFGWDAWIENTHADDRAHFADAVARFHQGPLDSFSIEHRLRHATGGYVWVSTRATVVDRDTAGQATRLIGTQTDITERRALENQFVQAQKLESIDRLAGGVAHDFNNQLTIVNGHSDILLIGLPTDDPNYAHVEAIRQAGRRAATLTQQLLAFSRKQPTQPRVIGINAELTECGPLIRRLVGDNVDIVIRPEATHDRVLVDPSQLHHLIMHLVMNARDAMPVGGRIVASTSNVTITEKTADAAAGDYVALTITDTGVGMTSETLARIYEPFFTTKERGKGTGLGLSMVYGAVHQAGGFIRVESALGRGTTLSIHWPPAQGAVEPTASAAHSDSVDARVNQKQIAPTRQGTPITPVEQQRTILVVDDETSVRNLFVEFLGRKYRVLHATDGVEAIDIVRREPAIELMITDVFMPRQAGIETIQQARALRPQLRVIAMSGAFGGQFLRAAERAGVQATLLKPTDLTVLLATVDRVLGDTDSAR